MKKKVSLSLLLVLIMLSLYVYAQDKPAAPHSLVDYVVELYDTHRPTLNNVNDLKIAQEYIDLFAPNLEELKKYDLSPLDKKSITESEKKLSNLFGNCGVAYYTRGKSTGNIDDYKKAKEMYFFAVEINPYNVNDLLNLADFYRRIEKNNSKSMDIYDTVLSIEPDNPVAKMYLDMIRPGH